MCTDLLCELRQGSCQVLLLGGGRCPFGRLTVVRGVVQRCKQLLRGWCCFPGLGSALLLLLLLLCCNRLHQLWRRVSAQQLDATTNTYHLHVKLRRRLALRHADARLAVGQLPQQIAEQGPGRRCGGRGVKGTSNTRRTLGMAIETVTRTVGHG